MAKKILFTLKPLPPGVSGGGGCFFVNDLASNLSSKGYEIVYNLQPGIDLIFIIDPRRNSTNNYHIDTIINYKRHFPTVQLLYAVNECDIKRDVSINLEPLIVRTISACDVVVFISKWLKNYYAEKYPTLRSIIDKSYVINNGCDLDVFYPERAKTLDTSSTIKLVTHHWSDNYNKGFHIYNRLAGMLKDLNVEFTYIGRYYKNAIPEGVNYVPPKSGKELADEIRKHDIYLTASLYEPGGIHQLEGMACGLPVLYRQNGGGIAETIFGCGEEFAEVDDLLVKLKQIVENYDDYRSKINYDFISSKRFSGDYYKLIQEVLNRRGLVASINRGGLANRIRCLASVIKFANNKPLDYRVRWEVLDSYEKDTHILNCSYNKLFSNDIELTTLPPKTLVYKSHCLLIEDRDGVPDNFNTFNSNCSVKFTRNDSRGRNIDFMYDAIPDAIRKSYIDAFSVLKPAPELITKIDQFSSKYFTEDTVSVHIRSWNRNGESGRRDYLFDVVKFEKEMRLCGSDVRFYMATDSKHVVNYFKGSSEWRDRVIFYDRSTDLDTSRDFPEGVQEDLIELYLLSKNSKLIGSHFSTFSEVAWWLGGCMPVKIL